ncbi:hypothetical protein [Mannheimia pernigra]|uniref:Phospholipase D-like domain-containing protein n=1 Tax=Mannheimia pernigra TaxID=111844 RepID=A0A7D5HS40_9PAST|nr:hypothetical protein [Mannheimia pernigra]QLB39749.1 hypothetical protein HV559_02010 [Mannheimia pernigra]
MNVGYHRKKEMFNLIELEIMKNLNHLIQTNNSIKVEKIEVVFRNVISRLIDEIKSHELVFGYIAWLTVQDVLKELKNKQCQIVLQKEDFLHPDLTSSLSNKDKQCLRYLYDNLLCNLNTTQFSYKIKELSIDGILDLTPVTCFGYYNQKLRHYTPKMHNKFFIFAKIDKKINKIQPLKVWTGSANITHMSINALENDVIIDNEKIAGSLYERI